MNDIDFDFDITALRFLLAPIARDGIVLAAVLFRAIGLRGPGTPSSVSGH